MDDIFKRFRDSADPERAAKMSAYMKNQFDYLGLATPERRKLSRDLLKSLDKAKIDWDFIFKCWEQAEREFQYLATDILAKQKNLLKLSDLPKLKQLITTKSWWDTVDSLDTEVGTLALNFPEVNQTLLEWSLDENIWLRRIAIDHQLLRKDKTNTELLEKILVNNLEQSEFFINKAIGWALRDYSKTNPDWVRTFIDKYKGRMAGLSIREGSKYS